jgi:Xaa-Pro aminopeptidase
MLLQVHYGQPDAHLKRCFTRVLQGHVDLARAVFPEGTPGPKLDVFARAPLWADGLDYRHGM